MPQNDEVTRLTTVLKGFYFDSIEYWEETKQDREFSSIQDFWKYDKRPYGNKSIEESIVFNLGWDRERRLCTESMPDFVKEEARKIHELVGRRIHGDL